MGGAQGRRVEGAFDFGAGEAVKELRKLLVAASGGPLFGLRVFLDKLDSRRHVRVGNLKARVKAAGANQGRVQRLNAVCGRDDQHALGRLKAVQFVQQSGDDAGVFRFNRAARIVAAGSDSVKLVDENDAGRAAAGLGEKQFHFKRANRHEHRLKVGGLGRNEIDARLARQGFGKKRLSISRLAFKQYAFGKADALLFPLARIFHYLHDLRHVALQLVHADNVGKLDAGFSDDFKCVGRNEFFEHAKNYGEEDGVKKNVQRERKDLREGLFALDGGAVLQQEFL